MGPGLRIVWEVLSFRVRRFEMANLAASLTLLVALRSAWPDALVRMGLGLALNLLAYLINDYLDVDRDLADGRCPDHTRYLAEHRGSALGAMAALGSGSAAAALLWEPTLLGVAVAGVGICWLYSRWLKAMPYVDVAAMIGWGMAMPLVAVPLGSVLGWVLIAELGLFSAAFETIQIMRDYEADRRARLRTTAVRLGPRRSLTLVRATLVAAGLYGAAVISVPAGLLVAGGAAVPFPPGRPAAYWQRIRLVLGTAWLFMLLEVFRHGASAGGWLRLDAGARLFRAAA